MAPFSLGFHYYVEVGFGIINIEFKGCPNEDNREPPLQTLQLIKQSRKLNDYMSTVFLKQTYVLDKV